MTTVKIELSDDQVETLRMKATAQGLTLEGWFQRLAEQQAPAGQRKRILCYNLTELPAQSDPNSPLSDEDLAWMTAPSVGRESD